MDAKDKRIAELEARLAAALYEANKGGDDDYADRLEDVVAILSNSPALAVVEVETDRMGHFIKRPNIEYPINFKGVVVVLPANRKEEPRA